jgi:hypothetical protein
MPEKQEDDSTERALPVIMGGLYRQLDDLNVRTQQLLDLQRLQIPVGYSRPLEVVLTGGQPVYVDSSYIMPDGANFDPPYISADIYNNGPDNAYFRVNDRQLVATAPLLVNAMYVQNMAIPQLRSVMLWNEEGMTSDLIIYFKR